jgi:MFS transporter, OFA family, oxalate/formate antiporter
MTSFRAKPWLQLVAGIVCMAMVANLQYGWTLFVDPIHARFGWTRAAIQLTFTIFLLVETWLVPFEAALVDRFGPRNMVIAGGVFAALGWVVNASASSLGVLYLGGILAGVGAGMVYGTCIGNALKWFAANRGLAAGLTAAGFGAGASLTVIPLTHMVRSSGYQETFLVFGLLQGLIVVIAGLFLMAAPGGAIAPLRASRTLQGTHDFAPMETLQSPVFWVMYAMFVLVAAGGLMAVAQLAPIAKDFHVATAPVTLFGITAATLTYALSLNNLVNGITRPVLGWVSDQIGRELTMFLAFILEGFGILALMRYGHSPVSFVLLCGIVFFAWGEIFSIFPSTMRDHFGQKFATTNYGMLYTAKGTAAFIVPLASVLTATTGSWTAALSIGAAFNIVAALISIAILRPLRLREIGRWKLATVTRGTISAERTSLDANVVRRDSR